MLAQKLMRSTPTGLRPTPATRPALPHRSLVVSKASHDEESRNFMALPMASIVAGALLTGALCPDAAEASKSQGRVGGSSGFKSSRAAPQPRQQTTTVNNTVIGAPAMAPPVYGGYGMGMPFFGGFSFMPTFVMPFPFFGGILQFFLLMFVVSAVFNVVRAVASNSSNNGSKKKDDGWGDL